MPCEHNSCNHSCVHHVPIFKELTSDDIQLVATAIQSKRYNKGDYIFREGENSNKLYIVNEGIIKIAKLSDQGKQQIIRFLFPGDFFGLFALLQEKRHYADAEVLDDAMICVIEKQHLTSIMERNPRMAYQFLVAVSERLGQADEWLGTISLMETEQRLAKLLILFYDKNNNKPDIQLPVQKKELASLLGTTPETLSRKLSLFEDQGLIKVARSYIHILQPRLLQSLAGS
jgi:CRP-like cAMP-binding protein